MINIFFDIDGVIIPSSGHNITFERTWDDEVFNKTGVHPYFLTNHFFVPHFKNILIGNQFLHSTLTTTLKKHGYSNTHAKAILEIWFNAEKKIDTLVIDIVNKLRKIKNTRFFIASNQSQERADFLWYKVGLRWYFDDIFISSRLKCLKNDMSFFKKIESVDCYSDNKYILIDDDIKNIKTSQKCGWTAIHYTSIKSLDGLEHMLLSFLT